uniref:NUDIX hydrolase n=1 Tax=Tessaracoccus timonensis TaxID=2161816 RepID=UPI001E3282A6|nr:NUDIX domain-containing protein [Tessaracoccus timonensis]
MPTRRVKRRRATRILVVADDEVLLQEDSDSGIPGSRWWVTPGGGVDSGESLPQAAVRELWEETGLEVAASELRGPVAEREVCHGYSDRILIQHETFFRVDVDRFEPDPAGLTPTERQRMQRQAWFPVDTLPDIVWPARLGELLTWEGGGPLQLGKIEESTVPARRVGPWPPPLVE